MNIQAKLLCAIAVSGFAFAATAPAQALTMQECSAKYKAAKAAGTAGDMKWNDFRKAQCSADATPAAAPVAAPAPAPVAAPAPAPAPAAPKQAKKEAAPPPAAAPSMPGMPAVYPNAVDPKYAQETPGKQRFKTCDDQYKANKATGGNAGMKWIEKGGGYWSMCNKHLKGA